MAESKQKASEEQLVYAGILEKGMQLGLLGLIITFVIYMSGILPAKIPVDQVGNYWGMSVHEYLAATGMSPGWTWVRFIGNGDFINFIPIAILAGVTILCYMAVIPVFLKKKDKVYAIIGTLEVLVLVLAASGVLKGGGH
ncbi:MAG: hypothetical protein HZA22_06885 [Nitrospirae bacterium]|nr:hypothetical protein [Nitrospirota bacterium]MBI5695022.1 hypothetical protein [Nitrospirota bacterium]